MIVENKNSVMALVTTLEPKNFGIHTRIRKKASIAIGRPIILSRTSKITASFVAGAIALAALPADAALLVSNAFGNNVLQYDDATGAFGGVFASGGNLVAPIGLTLGPDSNLYVSSGQTGQVLRYNGTTGAFIDVFTSGGDLQVPTYLIFGPDSNLYVSSYGTNQVLRYNGTTGAFIDTFASGGGLVQPEGLSFGPDGNLYVSSFGTNEVLRYNGTTGAFIDTFASGGNLNDPLGLTFGLDGNLYVSSSGFNEFPTNPDTRVLRYNGTTGDFIDVFASGNGLNVPHGLAFGPDSELYVNSFGQSTVLQYNDSNGAFIDVFASGNGLSGPAGLIFTPTPVPEPSSGLSLMVAVLLATGYQAVQKWKYWKSNRST